MKCIIVGVGKVGYSLAANLCAEGHEVTVIDNNRRRLDIIEDHLNVTTVEGNAAQLDTLHSANIENADLLIAVTEKDELNMVACFVSKEAGVKSAVARVRNPGYSDFDNSSRMQALGIDMLINPEKVAAAEIVKLISFPEANYVGYFGDGQVLMLELHLDGQCSQLNKPLRDIPNPVPCIVVGIEREGKLLIPRGDTALMAGDDLLILANTEDMRELERFLNIPTITPRDVVIIGGSLAGFYLAQMLEQSKLKLNVKLLENDFKRCEEMAAMLKETVIIYSDATNVEMYEDENVGDCDVFVAISDDDKENLFASMLAKSMGAKKTVTQIRGSAYAPILAHMGLDKVVGPNRLTTDAILRFIDRSRILSLTRFDDSQGQITEYRVPEKAKCAGRTLMELKLPRCSLICMIIRGDQHIIPQGRDVMRSGDTVIVFSMAEVIRDVEAILTDTIDTAG